MWSARLLSAALCVAALAVSVCAADAAGRDGEPVSHRFFKCGWKSYGPGVFNERFEEEWSLECKDELSDGWALPDGGIVYSFSRRGKGVAGVIRLDGAKKKMWEYRVPQGHDNHSCQPLPHGGFLAGDCAKDGLWMVEIDGDGKEIKRIRVADAADDPHHAFRQVRQSAGITTRKPTLKTFW